MKQDMILILDLGSDENTRLAREIRALGVYTEIHPHDISQPQLAALPNVKGIILNGGVNPVSYTHLVLTELKRIEAGNSVDEELMNVIELIAIILGDLKGEDENGE